jgi:hypothetical protein
MNRLILGRYTRQGLWSLFLMCALPLHAWALLLAFRDLSWLTDRTNAWDAVGVLCYGLLFALIESLLLFVVTALLGLLIPRRWEPERRTALLSVLVLVLCVWAMLGQLFFLTNARLPEGLIAFLVRSGHPLRIMYPAIVVLVGVSFVLPAWAVMRSARGLQAAGGLIERLGLLAMLYLVFDAAALVIVVIRNL